MSKNAGLVRLQKEYKKLLKTPMNGIHALPSDDDMSVWYYLATGPKNTPFENGQYFGKVVFPPEYPYAPPAVYMYTPNGCFGTNEKVCMSMTDLHPETWNPLWGISTILPALVSFMTSPAPTLLASDTTDEDKRLLARRSIFNNLRLPAYRKYFQEFSTENILQQWQELFPSKDIVSQDETDDTVETVEEEVLPIEVSNTPEGIETDTPANLSIEPPIVSPANSNVKRRKANRTNEMNSALLELIADKENESKLHRRIEEKFKLDVTTKYIQNGLIIAILLVFICIILSAVGWFFQFVLTLFGFKSWSIVDFLLEFVSKFFSG